MRDGQRTRVRTFVIDQVTALCITGFMVGGTVGAARDNGVAPVDLPPLAYILVLVGGLVLGLRRLYPLPCLGVATLATCTYLAAGYPFGPVLFSVAAAALYVGLGLPPRPTLIAVGAVSILLIGAVLIGQDLDRSWLGTLVGLLATPSWVAAAAAIGLGVRSSRLSAEQTRAESRRQQSYEERLQTAREVHDIVGHGLAAISVQAGAALHVLDRSPERTRELLASIRDSSQHALEELRATLAVFRGAHAPELAPLAGLDGLDALIGRLADSGVPVDVRTTGTPVALLSTVDHAAYRIVQESLTNVLRHAGRTTATVRLAYAADRLTVVVADHGSGPRPGSEPGQGVAGMRARAESLGGSLSAGPAGDRGYRVHAELPLAGALR